MPPRYAYWTIIAGGLPTAFRAADRDELLPTFSRIKEKHPDAQMKWFARGKLWDSPESARREADARRRAAHSHTGSGRGPRSHGETRGRDWRPGGEHRDARQKYRDAKKARNVEQRKRKFDRRQRAERTHQPPSDPRNQMRPPDPSAGWRKSRRFEPKHFVRNQEDEKRAPARPERPGREPGPRETNEPAPPPRPSEPVTAPPGPPERGRPGAPRRRRG